ncbi:class I SAM-dependent methyltransferase [Bradyrhizobium sp. LHD-71]|uniref:class I SAM-dependent methyltransferase n=1 Tax=Bradyrhizobium sp. LHD-71 TaxID=3072141 RepID=UPI00280FDD52|nr:class I SAM-dependent methyltransferase [Bradyrhizobium sp. LHD-71]MDQ8729725.1 class I SAM-dependent methyltransferase [Bradyrhizobium sp. LHD-71]
MSIARHHHVQRANHSWPTSPAQNTAALYNKAGTDYIAYADGNPEKLFAFEGLHGYADRQIWLVLLSKLIELRASRAASLVLLDAGCGPGTWLRRIILCAHDLGFERIVARGFDIAESQVAQARLLASDAAALPGVHLTFEVADLTRPLPEMDGSVDITLCLYSVLSHIPPEGIPQVLREIARVTYGHFVTAVRSVGSTPSAFTHSVESIRYLRQDHERNVCEIELHDGTRSMFPFHLFTESELRGLFAPHFGIEEVRGLDLFHTRFANDPRWSPPGLQGDDSLANELAQLEAIYAAKSGFVDRAAHIMLVAQGPACRDVGGRQASTAI